jgi:hypothetical protein
MHYRDPGSPFPQYLEVEGGLRPSTAVYALLTLLGRLMPLEDAEKVLVSLAILLLPAALLLLLRRALPRRTGNALLALPFVVGWAFAMGFLSFLFAMGFGVLALALGWEAPAGEAPRQTAWLSRALAALSFLLSVWFHPVGALITGLALLLLEAPVLARPSSWSRLLVVVSPGALFLAASYLAARTAAPTPETRPETHFADPPALLLGLFEHHLGYTPWELVPRAVALVILVRFAVRGIRARPPLGSTAEGAVARVVLVFLLLYCVTPVALRGWFYASTRFLLFASLLLPAVAEIPPGLGRRLVVLSPVLTGAVLAVQWPNLRSTSRQMADVVEVGREVRPGSKIVPMDFTARLLGPQPLAHAWAQLAIEHDAIASQLFAAGKPRMGGEAFRTLTFRPGVLGETTGSLPWSTGEGWYDVVRKCSASRIIASLQSGSQSCDAILAERKATLDRVLDRYDYVLMIDPPDYALALLATRLRLVASQGAARLFRVVG